MIPTCFSQLIGNEFIKECLQRLVSKKAIAHSLLFSGPEGVGKSLFAQVLAALLMGESEGDKHIQKIANGMHPDVHIYRPEGKIGLHSIQSLRKMCDEIYLPPYEASCKVFIVHDAHRMLSYSANALLKTFEEPPPRTKIILLTDSHHSLLPTILSRCSSYFFNPISENEILNYLKTHFSSESEQALLSWARLSQGSIGQAVKLVKRKGNPLRKRILDALSRSELHDYKKLLDLSGVLTEEIDSRRKAFEEESREVQIKSLDYLTAIQKEILEKELEGASAMELVAETEMIFYTILSWYRDLSLMQAGGNRSFLINQDYESALEISLQYDQIIEIEKVQKIISETQLALKRSTSLSICLENLFLKLIL